jgi:hypothetical protein
LSRRDGDPQSRDILALRPDHRDAANIGLQLHQQIVPGQSAVHVQLSQRDAAVFVHGLQDVPRLEADRLEGRPDDVLLRREGRQAAYYPARSRQSCRIMGHKETYTPSSIFAPIGGVQAGEGGDEVHVARVEHFLGQRLGVLVDVLQEAHVVPQPGQRRARHHDAT